ncbi:MAG TPA: serine hydrolase domain-containing protein [Burkholderiales bacterium]|nr:serine hydrolase domain-containing protein [Burkholderiales bacterium]
MAIHRREFLKAGAALVASAAAQQGGIAFAATDPRQAADDVLQRGVDTGDVPGVIAMATTPGGTIYEGAFGKRSLDQDTPMSLDTVVWIASMTKALTGTAAMQMVEQGKFSLDEPAARIVPQLDETRVLTGWDGDKPVLRAPKRPITLRHLLTHTAGFAYELWNQDVQRYQKVMDLPGIGSCKNDALKMPLMFDPGERWEYGINIDFAGKMVEAVSGQKLGDYLRDNLFAPLGMDSSGFHITPDMRSRLARVHQRSATDGTLAPIDFEMTQEPEFEMGGGGLYSTAGDYLKFVRMMLNGGKGNGNQVLKPETVALMSKNAMGSTKVAMLKTAIPPLTNDAEFFPGMPKNWGLTFMINEHPAPTGRTAGSLAWAGLANTYYWIDQHKGVAGVYMTQVLPFADEKSLPLYYAFEKSVYQSIG